ncbi:MAG: ATP-binding cassette domain-containing protein [Brevibacterium sp.]|uniref:ATP-binding cassette domain-containing protein n=1 Tax=Brevibacterium sp. TaxID=1701 RepID=UPI002647D33A|nr:ATP-binding cassette domain-containing protein [Brevibacterium sp.]MDN5834167.1 ATP-binding cassette domain-containing protein [Brevibacterium sp.]MDN6134869.1 ATP-binding cassette domain-containing protein [Brevibacterium sp.]MDN6158512.1 ATP-binding cassette domain-containing protein [Brevibacterium sp.]MDN6176486.1 ATP-binding cassette domain-containing protein [Brevibacterium sp.]MDN6189105.1 ATP-binding cassette domain-containing protein [Brevibacterium sp.]
MQSNSETLVDETEQAIGQVSLRGWGVSGKNGDVFSGVELDVPRGAVAIIQGPAGSGKTSLLLSIAGRMRVASGEGHVGELDIRKQARRVREQVAVGHVAGLTDLENDFTLAQHIAERLIMLQPWYKPWVSKSSLREVIDVIRDTFDSATEVIDRLPEGKFSTSDAKDADFLIDDEGKAFVSELSELQKFLLELGLASLAQAPVVVLDNIDSLREREDRARAWAAILIYQKLRCNRDPEHPLTVIASCEDSADVDLVLDALASEVSPTSVSELSLSPHSRH